MDDSDDANKYSFEKMVRTYYYVNSMVLSSNDWEEDITSLVILRQLDLKHDTLIIIIKYRTRVLKCMQNTSRRPLRQQVEARSRWVVVVCLLFES